MPKKRLRDKLEKELHFGCDPVRLDWEKIERRSNKPCIDLGWLTTRLPPAQAIEHGGGSEAIGYVAASGLEMAQGAARRTPELAIGFAQMIATASQELLELVALGARE